MRLESGWRTVPSRLLMVGISIAAVALSTGCDPAPVPDDPNVAEVTVDVGAHGNAVVSIYPGGGLSDSEVQRLLDSIDATVFTEGSVQRKVAD